MKETSESRSLAERLGYSPTDRLLILHADDMGMCHSVNAATIQALEVGIVTCASVMIPCPWMPEAARYAREHPEADLGVHLTHTSEWQAYRWGPVTPPSEIPGLLDEEGYLLRSTREVVERASPEEVERECRTQIERALQFGFQPTHVDSHMGALFHSAFYSAYTRVAKEAEIMPMLLQPRGSRASEARERGIDPAATTDSLKREGFLFLDALNTGVSGDTLESRREGYYDALRNLPPGVNEIILHLSLDDPEIQSITGHWAARWHEFQIFTDPRTKELIDSLGIHLIGYRDLAKIAFQ
ncbi:MAG: polysaccharide deacetylase family protein [Armatimonadetes bacterium]|nr:polysaccharide deacetylase family protein [Armatimonadota bacterium]